MVSTVEIPLPKPPQPLAGLGNGDLALAVFNDPGVWLKYMNDLNAYAKELQEFAVDIKAQLDEIGDEDDPAGEAPPSPRGSEPRAASTPDTDDNSDIWVTEYTLSVSDTIPISKISGIVVMPRGSPPFVVVGSFSATIERRIQTKVRKPNGGVESIEASLVRENTGDLKPVNRFIDFGDLDLDEGSSFDIVSEQPGFKAEIKVETLRRIWKGARPRDHNGNRAKLIFEKKKSHKRDEAFLIPLNMEPEHEAPCNLVCQKKQIVARPYYLGQEMNIVLHRNAKKRWDPGFTINPAAQTGIVANTVR